MELELFKMLRYIEKHIDKTAEFYETLPNMTREDAVQIYRDLTTQKGPLKTKSILEDQCCAKE